ALTRAGRSGEAAALLRAAWLEAAPDGPAEDAFLARHAALVSAEDHARRFDRLLFSRDIPSAARQAGRLEGARQAAARSALAAITDRPEAEALAPGVAVNGDLGLLYARARWLRRRDRDLEAAALWRAEGPAA